MFKYYISEVEGGGGFRPSLISLMQRGGEGVQNLEKCADVILERFLMCFLDVISTFKTKKMPEYWAESPNQSLGLHPLLPYF